MKKSDKKLREVLIKTARELGLNVASAWPTEYLSRLVILGKHSQVMRDWRK